MKDKTVMILGAGRYYLRAIQSARDLGCKTFVIDKNPESIGFRYADFHACIDFSDAEASLAAARAQGVDAVIPLNDFGVPTASYIASRMGLKGISCEAAANATDKGKMRQLWRERGVPSARFVVTETLDEALEAVGEIGGFPVITKPCDSRGGASRGIMVAENAEELASAFSYAQDAYDNDRRVIVEEYLTGSEHSVETMTYDGKSHVLAVSDKVKTGYPYRVDMAVEYPSRLKPQEMESATRVVSDAIAALGIDFGPAHVEFCMTETGPVLFEIGARCGGGGTPDPIVPYVTGIRPFQEFIRMALGNPPQNLEPKRHRGCVYRFLTPPPGILQGIHNFDEIASWGGILDCDVFLSAGDEVPVIKTGHHRAGFIIAGGETLEEAIALADKAVETLWLDMKPIENEQTV